MSDTIHVLSDAVANQIAAGEVIQRPASVVKELMENSIDAGAGSVSVMVKESGKAMIQVADNGHGMSEKDAVTCFDRHATSKILRAEDLFDIHTCGFRGEALASVAAIAEVVLKTRERVAELGTQVRISGSRVETVEPVQTPPGSIFQVKNLFFNVPARRKFLKSDHTELRHIIHAFTNVALTRPDLSFSLIHGQTELLQLNPGNLKQRIMGVFGKSMSNCLIPIATETSLIRIHGFIGKAECARKTHGEQFFFANGRFIKHPYFHKAVLEGYSRILAPEHLPAYFVFLETDPSRIDVNIHPTKTEVKFEDERSIWHILHAAVREAIGKHNLSPSLDFEREGVIDIPVLKRDTEIQAPDIETNPDYDPFLEDDRYTPPKRSTAYPDDRHRGWEQLFEPEPARIPETNKVVQIKNKYILSSVKSGIMLIDQRRAHERIIYEAFMRSRQSQTPPSQQSLYPETVRLNASDYQVCLEMMEDLEKLGFDVRDLGNNSVVVHGFPLEVPPVNARITLETIIEHYQSMQGEILSGAGEKAARASAHASAVQYGTKLSDSEIISLIDRLFACSNPKYSPSGKPIVKILEMDQLDDYFND